MKGSVAASILFLVVGIIGFAGYVQNLITLFGMKEANGETIVRAIGVFVVPIGAIYGWF